jgi:hypothetical protein
MAIYLLITVHNQFFDVRKIVSLVFHKHHNYLRYKHSRFYLYICINAKLYK